MCAPACFVLIRSQAEVEMRTAHPEKYVALCRMSYNIREQPTNYRKALEEGCKIIAKLSLVRSLLSYIY